MGLLKDLASNLKNAVYTTADRYFDSKFGTYEEETPKEVENEEPVTPDIIKVMKEQGLFEATIAEQTVEEDAADNEELGEVLPMDESAVEEDVAEDSEDVKQYIEEKRAIFADAYTKYEDLSKVIMSQCKCDVFARKIDYTVLNAIRENDVVLDGDDSFIANVVRTVIEHAATMEDIDPVLVAVAEPPMIYNIHVKGNMKNKQYQEKLLMFLCQFISRHNVKAFFYDYVYSNEFRGIDDECEISQTIVVDGDTVKYYFDVVPYGSNTGKTGSVLDLSVGVDFSRVHEILWDSFVDTLYPNTLKFIRVNEEQCLRITIVTYVDEAALGDLCEHVRTILCTLMSEEED